ncbi:MAG TPA: isochorismatase family cysteine hydrolase [Caldimonas sp.]|nr:isochorismatase family cysteine hydrolase [Caldimonas sp.]
MPVKPDRAPLADRAASGAMALLVIDMISTWDFTDAAKVVPGALAIAPRIGALKQRCARAGVPVVFVNDNRGRWRSEFRELVRLSIEESETGATIAEQLQPDDGDYSVLKPKHSAFYATPLDLLLRHLRVNRLVITGVASDQCIVMSAAEATMRDYEVIVPRDCIADQTPARTARALRHLAEAHGIATTPSKQVHLPSRVRGARRRAG